MRQFQPLARRIQVYIRIPSWICPPVALPKTDVSNYNYTVSEKDEFKWNDNSYLKARKDLESQSNAMFHAFFKNSQGQKDIRHKFETRMKTLIPDENFQKHLIPTVTPNGIVAGGAEFQADILMAATGFNTTFKPRFPIFGANGDNVQDLGAQNPVSYLGTGVAGFSNYFIFLGPNNPISNGSLMGKSNGQ
ncbi:hypothetical protein QQZ08_009399 [Neonectria magnoliae]|uniref:Uncharacterized protein n=1 Tax=Neonectria magnoliae TaxID=2732573 RepID=A0ABR1HP85_9HYPO